MENEIGVTLSTRKLGSHKSLQEWQNQLAQRGWTLELIEEAIASGRRYPAPNYINQGNTATRYVSPRTGQSVVVDDQTGEILHVGAPGYRY
jgi:Colicin E5 ribonuclease domain